MDYVCVPISYCLVIYVLLVKCITEIVHLSFCLEQVSSLQDGLRSLQPKRRLLLTNTEMPPPECFKVSVAQRRKKKGTCKQGIMTKKPDYPQLPISDFTVVFKLQYKIIIY